MGYSIAVLCSPAAGAGFRLAGLAPIEIGNPADIVRQFSDALARPGLGVLLVEESIYKALPDAARRALSRRPIPMVVPFPAPAWTAAPEEPESFIAELLRQAIGYRVKLA